MKIKDIERAQELARELRVADLLLKSIPKKGTRLFLGNNDYGLNVSPEQFKYFVLAMKKDIQSELRQLGVEI
jgi:hypothetical protein